MAITNSEWESMAAVTLLLSLVSATCDVILIFRILKAGQSTASRSHIIFTSACDLFGCFGFALGAIHRLSDGAAMESGGLCTVHGLIVHAFDLAAVFGTVALTHGAYLMVRYGEKKAAAMVRPARVGIFLGVAVLTLLAVAGAGDTSFEPELVWCSVSARPRMGPLMLMYGWVLLAHCGAVIVSLLSKQHIQGMLAKTAGQRDDSNKQSRAMASAVKKIFGFPAAVHIVWTPSYMLVVQMLVDAKEPLLFFVLMNAIFRPAKGLLLLVLCHKMVGIGQTKGANGYRVATSMGPSQAPPRASTTTTISVQETAPGATEPPLDNPGSPSGRVQLAPMENKPAATKKVIPTAARPSATAQQGTGNTPPPKKSRLSPKTNLILKACIGAVVCVLCLGFATAGVAYGRRYSRVALEEARDTAVATVALSANDQVKTFLAGPTQIKATLDYNANSQTQWDLENRNTWETLIAPYFMSNTDLLAIYSATSKRQVIKVHRETADHLCTQVRTWTPVTGEYQNTTRTDMCRPDDGGDYWTDVDFWDPDTETYISPSYTKLSYYDPFAKGWYIQANESSDASTIYWNGPVFQSYTSEGLTQLDPVLEMVFRVEWLNLEPNNYYYEGPYYQQSNHKFKFATNALNDVVANLQAGENGAVFIANEAGAVVAAPHIDQQLYIGEDDLAAFFNIWEVDEVFEGLETVTATDDDAGSVSSLEANVILDLEDATVTVIQLELVPEWRLIVLTYDDDFLKESTALYEDMQVFSLLGSIMVLALMWKAFFDLRLSHLSQQ